MSTFASTAIPSDNSKPAIPGIVNAVWKELIIPKVKNKLNRSAMFASIPGMKLYSTTMYAIRMMKAMMNEIKPCWIDCAPSVGPTTSS